MFQFVDGSLPVQPRVGRHQARNRRSIQERKESPTPGCNADANGHLINARLTDVGPTGTINKAHSACFSGSTNTLFPAVSSNLLDPFNTLCESPERLRQLLRHPSAKSAGEPLFRIDQQINTILFQSLASNNGPVPLLADKALFHALSLLLALVANGYQPNYETMHHRGQVLESLNMDLFHSNGDATSIQTITAILLLISYEYRVQGTCPSSAATATHILGLQSIINQRNILTSGESYARTRQVQRALLWQDIICSLTNGTPRLLKLGNYDIFTRLRETQIKRSYFVLPQGFIPHIDEWPGISSVVFEDLNAMCYLVDGIHEQEELPYHLTDNDKDMVLPSIPLMEDLDEEGYPLYNGQADLEVRLVDLLSETTRRCLQKKENLIYRACLFAAYLCTYRLSAGLWEGHFVPEKCVTEILDCMADFKKQLSPWSLAPDISFWLLHVAGGLTKSQRNKTQAALLVQRYRCFYSTSYYQDWEIVEMKLKEYIWCEHTMKAPLYDFWQQC